MQNALNTCLQNNQAVLDIPVTPMELEANVPIPVHSQVMIIALPEVLVRLVVGNSFISCDKPVLVLFEEKTLMLIDLTFFQSIFDCRDMSGEYVA